MNKSMLGQLAIFVVILLALRFFFGIRVSIIGSLLLTIGLSFVLNRWR